MTRTKALKILAGSIGAIFGAAVARAQSGFVVPGARMNWDTPKVECPPANPIELSFCGVEPTTPVQGTSTFELNLDQFMEFRFTYEDEEIRISGADMWKVLNS